MRILHYATFISFQYFPALSLTFSTKSSAASTPSRLSLTLSLSLLVLAPLSPSILLTLPPLHRFASPHPLPTLCPFLFPSVVPFHKPRPSPSSTSFHFLTLQSTSVHSISLPCSSALPYSCAAPPRPLSLLLPPFPGAHWPHSSLVQLSDVLIIFRLTATLPLSSQG